MTYIRGVDLGYEIHPTARVRCKRVERLTKPKGLPGTWQEKNETLHTYSELQTVALHKHALKTPYQVIFDQMMIEDRDPRFVDTVTLVDATGNAAAVQLMSATGITNIVPITFTGGHMVTQTDDGGYHVPKVELVRAAQVVVMQHRVKVSKKLPLATEFGVELKNLESIDTSPTQTIYADGPEPGHADLAIAFCMICWWVLRLYGFAIPQPHAKDAAKYDALKGREYGE